MAWISQERNENGKEWTSRGGGNRINGVCDVLLSRVKESHSILMSDRMFQNHYLPEGIRKLHDQEDYRKQGFISGSTG